MALAQYLTIPKYFDFFKERLEKGDEVIMDNGAYEGAQVSMYDLLDQAKRLQPTCLVLPDAPYNFRKTICLSEKFLDWSGWPAERSMTVLHAPDGQIDQFCAAYSSCRTAWVGFSKLTNWYRRGSYEKVRPDFARILKAWNLWRPELKHHALGMKNGNIEELALLAREDFYSCDSSAPLWRGFNGIRLGEPWNEKPFDPEAKLGAIFSPRARQNLVRIEEELGHSKSGQSAYLAG